MGVSRLLLLSALTIALIGCGKAGSPKGKTSSSTTASPGSSAAVTASAGECVVGVEGMS